MPTDYPVHYAVEHPARFTLLQLATRVLAFLALGAVGLSFGGLLTFAYLALPVIAATRLASHGAPDRYVREDGPRIVRVLEWIASVCGWAGLVTEELPLGAPSSTIRISIEGAPRPTPVSALLRVLTGLPSAIVLSVVCAVGVLVWLWSAAKVLFTQQVGPRAFDYLVGLQRWTVRLLAYQASLVDEYPPFSFADAPPHTLPAHVETV